MAAYHRRKHEPRSTIAFALALTLTVATLWVAGLAFEVHSYAGAVTADSAAEQTTTSSWSCPFGADDPALCRSEQ